MHLILANGTFPSHPVALQLLRQASHITCCDGALEKLVGSHVFNPDQQLTIVGDGDSLQGSLRERYAHCYLRIPEQDTNDLTKTVRHCLAKGPDEVVILGATGLREDHTLGNISLLAGYATQYPEASFRMVTDHGIFTPVSGRQRFESFPRQQVSIFTFSTQVRVTAEGLEYPVEDRSFDYLWQGTLNAALGDEFTIASAGGVALVYQTHEAKE